MFIALFQLLVVCLFVCSVFLKYSNMICILAGIFFCYQPELSKPALSKQVDCFPFEQHVQLMTESLLSFFSSKNLFGMAACSSSYFQFFFCFINQVQISTILLFFLFHFHLSCFSACNS